MTPDAVGDFLQCPEVGEELVVAGGELIAEAVRQVQARHLIGRDLCSVLPPRGRF